MALTPEQLLTLEEIFSNDPRSLEQASDGAWVKHYFPDRFSRPFTQYQKDFFNWANTVERDERPRPRVECHPRGVGKSTCARALCVKLLAEKKKDYVFYVSGTEEQAQKHFNAIKSMLESPMLLADYPHLYPQVQKYRPNMASNWSRDRLVTQAGQVVEFISLLGNTRGFTTEAGKRPDLMVFDDIDDSKDGPNIVQKKLSILRQSIIPAKAENTLILFPQNLIHRDSICQQVRDQRADMLTDRIFVGPYPLMKWYDAERVHLDDGTGAMKWKVTAGEPADPAIGVEYCEQLLNDAGKDSFDRECQQDVFKVDDEKDFREWSEFHHIITYSEFRDVFAEAGQAVWDERRQHPVIPPQWNVGMGMDWGTTVKHPAACVMIARPNESCPFSDSFFVFSEVILPQYPLPFGTEPELVSPGRLVAAIRAAMDEWGVTDNQVKRKLMSHEASATLATMAVDLADDLKMFFAKWQAKKGSGVPQIQNLMELQDKPHPFRPVKGCPRLFFVVPDKQGAIVETEMGHFVSQAYDHKGFARARYEMPLYSHRNTGQNKIDDDFVDAFRGLMNVFGVIGQGYTRNEVAEMKLADKGLSVEDVQENPQLIQRRMDEAARITKKKQMQYRQVASPRKVGAMRR